MPAFHVAPGGNDRFDGSYNRPFATLTRARDAARRLKAGERRIVVREGSYFDACVDLGPRDSGLVIEAPAGERPVLCGGRLVTNWRRDGAFHSAEIPGAKDSSWDFRMLIVNGQWRPRARLPETGTFECLNEFNVRWMSTTGGGWERKPTEEELTTLLFRDSDLGPWLDTRSAEITVYHSWDESLVGVASLQAAERGRGTLRFSTPAGHPPGSFGNRKYVVWNVREGMLRPGQWYLDRTAGRLVYWPMPGEEMKSAEVFAPSVERIIRLEGTEQEDVKDVALRGLHLTATTTPLLAGGFAAGRFDGALSGERIGGCSFEALSIGNVGGHAIKLGNATGVSVAGCEVGSTGAGGIYARGSGVRIAGNHVHNVGRAYPSAAGMQVNGANHAIERNHVHDTTYSGIISSGEGSRFEHNVIWKTMQVLADGAAIYITFCKRMLMRGNVAHSIGPGSAGHRPAAHAYYLDEQAEDCIVEHNLAFDVEWPSHNHMARNCFIRENVFVSRGPLKMTFPRCEGFTLERNVVAATGPVSLHEAPGAVAVLRNNILFSAEGRIEEHVLDDYATREVRPLEPADGTIFADPLFVDRDAHDYAFKPDSPAHRLGISPLDVSAAGTAWKNRSTT